MNGESPCPIWNIPASEESTDGRHGKLMDSPRAGGRYFIARTAIAGLTQLDERGKARLTSWLVDQRRLGVKCPEIDSNTITMVKQRQNLSVHERADRLLQYIEAQTVEIGKQFVFTPREVISTSIAAWSESLSQEEVHYLLKYLDKQGWIALREYPPSKYNIEVGYTLTVEGYARLAELETANANSTKGFVAMWFDDSTNEAWEEGIKLGIEDAGYEAVRIDQKEHVNKIDDEIIAEIRRSRFVVADFTQGEDGARGGVYYEAGFAHGLDIAVIFTCREDALKHVHFDTRQYNHIVWKTPEVVVMFVPVEASVAAAFEEDPGLLEYALQSKVLITTPVTLLAFLKAVAYGWQQQAVSENARQIAAVGKELYQRITPFFGHLKTLRRHIDQTVESYNGAIGSLERRILPSVNRLQELDVRDGELDAPQTIDQRTRSLPEALE